MSLALLWALVFHGTAVYAYDSAVPAGQSTHTTETQIQADNGISRPDNYLFSGQLYMPEEGTISFYLLSLQPATTEPKAHLITFTNQLAIPSLRVRAPGGNFYCQFFYTFSQPQAP